MQIGAVNDIFQFTSGPRNARILLVGEAWGGEEARARKPFVGHSGKELDRMLFEAGLHRDQCLATNLVHSHPIDNDFTSFLYKTSDKQGDTLRGVSARPDLIAGHSELLQLVDRVKPDLIIGTGNWPLFALTPHTKIRPVKGYKIPTGITQWRGSQTYTEKINGTRYRYLPIIHPAAITRAWDLRNITVHDLRARASRFMQGKLSWEEPLYDFHYGDNFADAIGILDGWLDRANREIFHLCCDVETHKANFLVVVGLSDERVSLCIPFFYFDHAGQLVNVYTEEQEFEITLRLWRLLSHPAINLINQNTIYDFQFLASRLGVTPKFSFDTMLGQHLAFPGTPKALSYIASLYCDYYCYWKEESQGWDTKVNHQMMWQYNNKDTRHTFDAAFALMDVLKSYKLEEQYAFQMKQLRFAFKRVLRGIRYDTALASQYRGELMLAGASLERWLLDAMPEDLRYASSNTPWFSSNKQTQDIFYRHLKIEPVLHKKTKKPTVDKEAFETLGRRAPYLLPLLSRLKVLRSIAVYNSTFLSSVARSGRMRIQFNVGGTETFRWSSSANAFGEGLNGQNIPTEKED